MALTERLSILIEAHAGKAIAEFKKVGAASTTMGNDTTKATKGIGRLGQAGAAAGDMLKANLVGGTVAAAGALVAFSASSVKAVRELDAAILKFQRSSGATTEESSALIAAFDDMGIEAEVGSKAIFMLGKNLVTSKNLLAELGVAAVKNKAGNTDMAATLMSVADAYVNTADPARRAALLNAAFGRSGADLIPILEKGAEGIAALYQGAKDTGQIRTPEQVAQTEKLRVALDDLGDAANEMKLSMGTALIPFLTDAAKAITKTIEWGEQIRTLGGLIDAEKPDPAQGFGGWLEAMFGPKGATEDKVAEVEGGLGAFGSALDEIAGKIAFTDEGAEGVDKLSKALLATVDADRALVDAHRDVTGAQSDLNKLLKEGAVDEEKVADARTSLASATRSLADANRGVSKAQKEYDEAVAHAAALGGLDSALDLVAEAGENLADAQDTQASASERARAAAADLAEAQAGDPEFQTKLADARQKVADATFDMSQKSLASVNAHKEETAALTLHGDQVQRLYDLNAGLIAQNPDLLLALGPTQNVLAGAIPTFGGGGGDFPLGGPVVPFNGAGLPIVPHVTEVPLSQTTTNNVTINATTSEADARLIAREVIWNLN